MKKYSLLILLIVGMTSCKKWLDLQPETEVSKDELFKTEEGFQEALNGVYSRCVEEDLYGYELTFGLPEVLAQNYSISQGRDAQNYLQVANFNYSHERFIGRKDNAWKGLYNAIVNANLILTEIDSRKDVFSGENYNLIKGEALALRAFLHFDAFRLFGSFHSSGQVGIPYVTTYSNQVTPISSAESVLDKVIADLKAAKDLLQVSDSILSPTYHVDYPGEDSSTEQSSRILFHQNRRHRLNYYAVCGELARAYLYKNDKVNALANAEEVILSNKFPWTKDEDFLNADIKKKDRILYKELVFGWPIKGRTDKIRGLYSNGTASFQLKVDAAKFIYEAGTVGAEDNRYKQWFLQYDQEYNDIVKYRRNPDAREDDANSDRHPLMAPAIRLSEMYYIAAEASFETNPTKALGYFNEVRNHRGIGDNLNTASYATFMDELVKEARKEFYAEGQIFYMYKRLYRPIVGQAGNLIAPSPSIFVLPLPNNEIEFGGR